MKGPFRTRREILTRNIAVLLAAAGAFTPGASKAANGTWIGTAAGPFGWSTTTNWNGGIIAGGTPGDLAEFSSVLTAAQTINLDGDRLLGTLNFSGTAAFAFNIMGNNG